MSVLQIVEYQLRDNDPPATAVTLKRLKKAGYSDQKAKEMIGCAVAYEIFAILKNNEKFNYTRYIKALNTLS